MAECGAYVAGEEKEHTVSGAGPLLACSKIHTGIPPFQGRVL